MTFTQETVKIGSNDLVIIKNNIDGKTYYPLRYIESKILKRDRNSIAPSIKKENKIKLIVDFSKWGGGVQETNCVEGKVLIERLMRTQHRRFSVAQIENQNVLHRFLGIPELSTDKNEWNKYELKWCEKYDRNTRFLIENTVLLDSNVKARKCKKCLKVLPLIEGFYHLETGGRTFAHICTVCKNEGSVMYKVPIVINSLSKYERHLLSKKSLDIIEKYREGDYLSVYEAYRNGRIGKLPEEMLNREWGLKIIRYLIKHKELDAENLTKKFLSDEKKVWINQFEIGLLDIYRDIYGHDFYLEKWKYPKYTFRDEELKLDIDTVIIIFDNYLAEFNIEIEDPINFDYMYILNKCTLTGIMGKIGGFATFFVKYWNGRYAGYQFRNIGNYYKVKEENVLSDLKFLVEKDLKLPVEKIPLYVTNGLLTKEYKSIYNHLRSSGKNLFYYFDQLYPNRFNKEDFTIGRYRNEFDSIEEQQIDGVIREYFDNVIYNYKGDNRVMLKGKEPDWFIMTEKGVWIVEYFGMYIPKAEYNPIVKSYIDTTHEKLKLYDEMEGYKFVLVYPSDIEKGFLGLRDKLRSLKEEHSIS